MSCRANLVNGMLYASHTCSPAHSHILIAVTPHWVKACLHILALTRTLLFLCSFHHEPLSLALIFSLSSSSLSSLCLHHCSPSPLQGDDGVLGYCHFSPLLSQHIKRAGGADGCWQGVSSSSAETCNCVPGRETLVFVFLTHNTAVAICFHGIPFT